LGQAFVAAGGALTRLRLHRVQCRQRITSGVRRRQRKNQATPDRPLLFATIAPTIATTI
jgi:hypothetical protein